MPAPVRIGLAGYGLGGRYFHAPLIASAENCEFLGVVTTSPERRRQVAEDLGRPVFASLADLARAGAEAVAISTPAGTHVTLTQQALRLGLAVVCDKPFAPDADSARQVVRLSEQLRVPLTVYQNRRWDPDFLTVRELLDKGSLSALTVFESRFERFRPEHSPHAAGGGPHRRPRTRASNHAFEHIEHRRAVGLGVRADPDFGSSLRLVTAGGHPRAEPAELTMFIGWTWGAAVAMRIVDHVASLAAGRAGQRGGKYPKHCSLPGSCLDSWRLGAGNS